MSDRMTTQKVLMRAAELVDQGWCQDVAARCAGLPVRWNTPEVDQVCLSTALGRAVHDVTGEWPETTVEGFAWGGPLEATARAMVRVCPEWRDGGAPIRWNNAHGRTAEEVAGLLRRAAEAEEDSGP